MQKRYRYFYYYYKNGEKLADVIWVDSEEEFWERTFDKENVEIVIVKDFYKEWGWNKLN